MPSSPSSPVPRRAGPRCARRCARTGWWRPPARRPGDAYPAIILTPTGKGVRADGILTEGTGDVLRHGLAWLGGDFRDGPSEELAAGETIILESDAAISLEYDGELRETPSPARFALGTSAVDFVATA